MTSVPRQLTEAERFVLDEVRAFWGAQNSERDVFFTEEGEAALVVKARDGSSALVVVLTNLGDSHASGSLSLEELRRWIREPAA